MDEKALAVKAEIDRPTMRRGEVSPLAGKEIDEKTKMER